jgi:hypothetical protein
MSLSNTQAVKAGKLGYKKIHKLLENYNKQTQQATIQKWKKERKVCPQCKIVIPYHQRRNKFCSHKCASEFTQKEKGHRSLPTPRFCINCNKQLKKGRTKYCSRGCHKENVRRIYIKNWKNGKVAGYDKYGMVSNHIRNYLLKKRGKRCEKCGWNELNPFTKKIPLQLHHIDGNYKNTTEENLQIVCPNCHSLTKNYGGRGIGGRERRRMPA